MKHNIHTFCLVAIDKDLSPLLVCKREICWVWRRQRENMMITIRTREERIHTEKGKSTRFSSSTVWPQSSVTLIYCWLTCCADLYLHYLPSFHHKPQIYCLSECQAPKNLVSFFFVMLSFSLLLSFFSKRGLIPSPCHPYVPTLPCWHGV